MSFRIMPTYTAYGLTIQVPFACPALSPAPPGAAPDIVVAEGEVPLQLGAPQAEGVCWQASPGCFLWRGGPRAGRFLVEAGGRVTLQRGRRAEEELLAFHFLDAVLAAVLHQRGLLVLHANAAVTPNGAVAISGEPGAGKSTTLAALLQHGCAMLSDDITALRPGPDGCVHVLPGVPQMHLCEDSAEGLGYDIAGSPRFRWRQTKAAVETRSAMAAHPVPLRALYLLRTHSGDGVHIHTLTGTEKFAALQDCVYGPLLPAEHPVKFKLLAAVTAQATVSRIDRPAHHWMVDEVVARILDGDE
jgi:hypothetical protein